MTDDLSTFSRRAALQRTAKLGVTVAWIAPAVQVLGVLDAHAQVSATPQSGADPAGPASTGSPADTIPRLPALPVLPSLP